MQAQQNQTDQQDAGPAGSRLLALGFRQAQQAAGSWLLALGSWLQAPGSWLQAPGKKKPAPATGSGYICA